MIFGWKLPFLIIQFFSRSRDFGMRFFVFFVLLVVLSQTLHLQNHLQLNDELKTIQIKFIADIQRIKQELSQQYSHVQGSNDLDAKILVLQNLITSQRLTLSQAIQNYHYDLNTTSWVCQQFSPISKTAFETANADIRNKFNNLNTGLKDSLSGLPDYAPTVGLVRKVNDYMSMSQPALHSTGIQVPSLKERLIKTSNYNAGFWALGNSSVEKINGQLNSNSGFIPDMCPFYKPFADREGGCSQCPVEHAYFVFSGKNCLDCKTYNIQKRECYDQHGKIVLGNVYFSNFQAGKGRMLLLSNEIVNSYSNNIYKLPLCPSNIPFFNGTACMDCPPSLYFSLSELTCRSCPTASYYDPTSLSCKQLHFYSLSQNLSWSTTKKSVEDVLEEISKRKSLVSFAECPPSAPFSNNTDCIACTPPSHFSYDTLKCENCQIGTILSINMHRCVTLGNLNFQTNPATAPNLLMSGKSLGEWMNRYEQSVSGQQGISDCPSQTPYFDGISCISCPPSSPYFNLQTLVCQFCQGTTRYSPTSRECIVNDQTQNVQKPTWEKMAAAVFS